MSKARQPYTLVVGVDYSEVSELVLETAFDLAASKLDAIVHVVHVLPSPQSHLTPGLVTTWDGKVLDIGEAGEELRHYVGRILGRRSRDDQGLPRRVVTHVVVDREAEQLAQMAAELEADLLVVGTHGRRGVARLLLGSVAETTTRLAPCPVMVVRPKAVPAPIPAIEPPCPACLATRKASDLRAFWCEQHRERHGRRHTYFQSDRASVDGNFPLFFQR